MDIKALPCPECGKFIRIGAWPFCPHDSAAFAVRDDTIDFLAENAWREPRHFTSQKAYERALDADGLTLKPPKARGVEPVSAETLRWAAERLQARTKSEPVTVRDVSTLPARNQDDYIEVE